MPPLINAVKPPHARSWLLFLAVVLVATGRIVATYFVLSHTSDEPAHIASGIEWLDQGRYTYQIEDPPLAQVMVALLPFAFGSHFWNRPEMFSEGFAILNAGGHYDRTLTLARIGNLPFFWLAALVLFLWTRRGLGDAVGWLAVLFFTFLPPVLGHAGLATTDMALTATLAATILATLVWLEQPSPTRSILLSAALASGILSKFSFPAFFPAIVLMGFGCYALTERPTMRSVMEFSKARMLPLAAVLVGAGLLVWAGYRFSFRGFPAVELFQGFDKVLRLNRAGQLSYLFGHYSNTGFWYYYPVLLGFKTPLPVLALLCVGAVVCWRRRKEARGAYWLPAAFGAGILIFGPYSRINIGVRHVLPIYIAICIIAAVGARELWDSRSIAQRGVLAGLLLWMLGSSILSHPDYIAYFNELAGRHPEYIAVDSDLDWGQDAKRLAARLQEVGATTVAVDPIIVANPECVHGFPSITPLNPDAPSPGWNAVSITSLKLTRLGLYKSRPGFVPWPDRIPGAERVGKGILLWYFPSTR